MVDRYSEHDVETIEGDGCAFVSSVGSDKVLPLIPASVEFDSASSSTPTNLSPPVTLNCGTNAFSFSARARIAQIGYRNTLADLRRRAETLRPLLAAHGLALREDVINLVAKVARQVIRCELTLKPAQILDLVDTVVREPGREPAFQHFALNVGLLVQFVADVAANRNRIGAGSGRCDRWTNQHSRVRHHHHNRYFYHLQLSASVQTQSRCQYRKWFSLHSVSPFW